MAGTSNPNVQLKRALVVQPDSELRRQICAELSRRGFQVDTSGNDLEARECYRFQQLVITLAHSGPEAENFASWLALQSGTGTAPSYVIALTHSANPPSAQSSPPCNDLISLPADWATLLDRIEAVDSWLSGDPAPSSFYPQDQPAASPKPASTTAGGFQELIDRAPRPMAVCDREMRYLAVNRRWKKDFGLEGRNLIGQKHSDLFPYLGAYWEPAFRSVLLGHPEECLRDQWVKPSLQPAWVRWHLEPWSSKREPIGGFTITCEILEPDSGDALLSIGHSLLRSPSPMMRLSLEGRILEWNPAARASALSPPLREECPCFWDVFFPEEQRDGARARFLHEARQTLERNQFCFSGTWQLPGASPLPGRPQYTWAAHPLLDVRDRISGVLLLGLALAQIPPRQSMPTVAAASLAQMVEFAPFGLVLLDPDGRTVFANHEHAALLGFDLRSHASLDDWLRSACPHEQDAEQLVSTWKQSVWQEESARTFALRSSDHRLCHIRFQPRRTSDGGLLLALSDVTGFYQQLEHLEDTGEQFRLLFQHAQVGLALEDTSGKIVCANAACAALAHRTSASLQGQSFLDLLHPEDRSAVQARIAEIRQGILTQASSLDVRLPGSAAAFSAPDGPATFVRLTLCGIPDLHGRLLHCAYFLTDVAIERLKSRPASPAPREAAAASASLRLHALAFDQSEDAILITDPSGRILDWNPAATRLFGYSREAILGKSFSSLFSPRQPQAIHHAVAAAFAETGSWTGRQSFVREDGSEGICEVRYVAAAGTTPDSPLIIGFHRAAGAA